MSNFFNIFKVKNHIMPFSQIPSNIRQCVILGALLDSEKYLNPILYNRLEVALWMYLINPEITFLLTGCENDTRAMKTYLLDHGMQSSKIIVDDKGYNTFTSFKHMEQFFPDKRFIILTSGFHMKRCVYDALAVECEPFGIDMSEFEVTRMGVRWSCREKMAYLKDIFLSCISSTYSV